jgi:2-oxoglutarate dehydrogenase E2 component (dihydrolipoamide succinyltransferase)
MSERVTMPALGESVTEGTVTRWLKAVGERVEVDEPLLEVSTDKVDTEIPSPVAGVLQEILVQEDDTVPVGADLAVIGDGSDSDSSGGDQDQASQSEDNSGQSGDGDAIDDAQDAEAVKDAGDEGGQEPAEPSTEKEPEEVAAEASSSDDNSSDSSSGGSSGGGEVTGGTTVTMPALGESVTEGTITRWLKAEGDDVEVDEPLLEVSTDKVDTEIPSPAAGKLTKIIAGEDETVPVGADLAIIGGEAAAAPKEEAPKEEPKAEEPKQETLKQSTAPKPNTSGDDADASSYVTPLVRKLAADNDIDLASVSGTGIGGRIRKQDVLAAVEAKKAPAAESAPAPAPAQAPASSSAPAAKAPSAVPAADTSLRGTTQPMSRLRKVIAKRMVESLQVSAQLTTVVEVDVTKIARLRDRTKGDFEKREGTKLSFLPFFALAAVEALKAYPTVNASIEGDEVTYHGSENLGIAVDTDKGLLVPVLKNAGDLNIAGLARGIADVADRTRNNKITPDDLSGGTFTITNTGSRGALFDTPIINQPQVAILGTGAVVRRPVVVKDADGGETIAVRSMVYLALSYDHRIVDGADAARFLTAMKARLEEGVFDV